jgi:hypothetical protein
MIEALHGRESTISYMSTPISTGLRELRLCANLNCAFGTSRTVDADLWRATVFVPNCTNAEFNANLLRAATGDVVMNPAALDAPSETWGEPEYGALWDEVLFKHVRLLYLADDWEYSNGCRREVELAARHRLPIASVATRQVITWNPTYDLRPLRATAERAQEEWPAASLYPIDWKVRT